MRHVSLFGHLFLFFIFFCYNLLDHCRQHLYNGKKGYVVVVVVVVVL